MESLVDFESPCSRVLLIAANIVADKGFQASVSEFMSLQMTFCDKRLITLVALKGSLSSVGPHVSFKVASLAKLFQTSLKWTQQKFHLIFWSLHTLDP